MKLNIFLILSLVYTLVFGQVDQQRVRIDATFRSTKNILFVANAPGSSHVTWVLRFLDELSARGHNITMVTVEENLKYSYSHPYLNTVSMGSSNFDHKRMMEGNDSHKPFLELFPVLFDAFIPGWPKEYRAILEQIEKNKADVLICDFFSNACMEAANTKQLPFILTSTAGLFPDAAPPYINANMFAMDEYTTVHQSIYRRFFNKFILPIQVIWKTRPILERMAKVKRESGLINARWNDDPNARSIHAVKLIGNMFGPEAARPLGPLVEFVGPMLEKEYNGLTTELKSYLDARQKVVYVAFGQHARPLAHDVERILTSLIHQLEKGHIDGIIWSSVLAESKYFPTVITSSYSRKTYSTASFFDGNKGKVGNILDDIFVSKWSPQMAILLHPSVHVFVSHGGANSLFECLYAGKRLLFYPFFGDQPGTAKHLSQAGVSEYFNHLTDLADVDEKVEKVILDREGHYQEKINKYQAMMQIQSKSAPIRAADVVEEVAFSSQGTLMPHREDVSRSLSFAKKHNLDIYALAIASFGSIFIIISLGLVKLVKTLYHGYHIKQKTKTL
ncbi:uncharacterized protein BX664DRAFT_275256 [Halteromyces radiatus]|uniref:uncharacterized protein n=1 Tax=Halteromyces radiatus TaxID=101107 RepID=UPI00221F5CC8|nr:uncharacterized protein BX664DRAFT_275256 [Halteromyces radiatus]KAI8096884.1 hypothetical protein BX664DRAFT_275256 [Halteromyces radiatus]